MLYIVCRLSKQASKVLVLFRLNSLLACRLRSRASGSRRVVATLIKPVRCLGCRIIPIGCELFPDGLLFRQYRVRGP
jgi:hypothetical protein